MVAWVIQNWELVFGVILGAHGLASAIVALTPTPKDDEIVGKVYKVIEKVALVVGKAKDDPNKEPAA